MCYIVGVRLEEEQPKNKKWVALMDRKPISLYSVLQRAPS